MNIELITQKSELAVAVKKPATMETMKALIDEGYGMIWNHLTELGKRPSGAPYIAYLNCSEDFSAFDMEMGFPVAEELPVKGEMYLGKTYGGKVVTGTHKGPYTTLEQAYGELMQYMEDNALESTGVYYDYYLNDPSVVPEDELLTKIVFPVK